MYYKKKRRQVLQRIKPLKGAQSERSLNNGRQRKLDLWITDIQI